MVDPRTNVFCVAPTSSNEATNSSKTLAVSFSWFYKTNKKYIHWWAGNQSRFSWMNICRNRNIVFVNQKYITGIRIHPTLSKISGHPGILTPKIVGGLPDFSTCLYIDLWHGCPHVLMDYQIYWHGNLLDSHDISPLNLHTPSKP